MRESDEFRERIIKDPASIRSWNQFALDILDALEIQEDENVRLGRHCDALQATIRGEKSKVKIGSRMRRDA